MDTIRIISKEGRFVIRSTNSSMQILSYGKRGLPGAGVATGGTAGQILSKRSAADYDTEWVDTPEGGVISVNGRTGAVVGLAEKSELDTVESELSQELQDGDAATLSSANSYTDSQISAIDFPVDSVAGKTGAVTLNKGDVGLPNVDNTSDANKPVSTATQTALTAKLNQQNVPSTVYGINGSNTQVNIAYSNSGGTNNIPLRLSTGQIIASDPTASTHLTTKSYVDTGLSSKADATALGNYVLKAGDTSTGLQTFAAGATSTLLNITDSSNGIRTNDSTRILRLSGGTTDNGAVILLGGSTNGTIPGIGLFRVGSTNIGNWNANGFLLGSGASPTHTLTLPSTATGIALYNTTDQTTNYERLRINNSGNIYQFMSEAGGTGTVRGMQFGTNTSQPIGFFGATPVVQQAGTTDLGTVLSNLGLRVAGSSYPITTAGGVTFSNIVSSNGGIRETPLSITASTTLVIGTAKNRRITATGSTAIDVTLPLTGSAGHIFRFYRTDANPAVVTIIGTINGNGSGYVLNSQYKYVEVMSTSVSGTWEIWGE